MLLIGSPQGLWGSGLMGAKDDEWEFISSKQGNSSTIWIVELHWGKMSNIYV